MLVHIQHKTGSSRMRIICQRSFSKNDFVCVYLCLFFGTRNQQNKKKSTPKMNLGWREKLKGKHDSIFLNSTSDTAFPVPAVGVLKRNCLIHIWCSRLSFLQTLANLSLIYCFSPKTSFCQWNNLYMYINFLARCIWKINHKSMSEVLLFFFFCSRAKRGFSKRKRTKENLKVIWGLFAGFNVLFKLMNEAMKILQHSSETRNEYSSIFVAKFIKA